MVLLTACKVEVVVPEGGRVDTVSGAYSCEAGQTCSVDVSDEFFAETFVAEPGDDNIFSGWNKGFRRLCGGSLTPCELSTGGFDAYQALLDILASDEIFYLEPTFLPKDSIRRYQAGNQLILTGTLAVEELSLPPVSSAVRATADILEGVEALDGKEVLGLRTTLTRLDNGDSTATTSQFWQEDNGAFIDLTDDGGYYYWDIAASDYGETRIPVPMVESDKQVSEFYTLVPGHTFGPLASGTRSIIVGDKQIVEVPMGTYEVTPVTVADTYTYIMSYADKKRDSSVQSVRTYWISPAKGIVKMALRDREYSSSGKLERTQTLNLKAVRANF
jgi:hypothetical protein